MNPKRNDEFRSPTDWPEKWPEIQEIDNLLRCGICYEYMTNPMILPLCSHNYCSLCIRKYIGFKMQCPTCFANVVEAELRNNRCIDQILINFRAVRERLLHTLSEVDPNIQTVKHKKTHRPELIKSRSPVNRKRKAAIESDTDDFEQAMPSPSLKKSTTFTKIVINPEKDIDSVDNAQFMKKSSTYTKLGPDSSVLADFEKQKLRKSPTYTILESESSASDNKGLKKQTTYTKLTPDEDLGSSSTPKLKKSSTFTKLNPDVELNSNSQENESKLKRQSTFTILKHNDSDSDSAIASTVDDKSSLADGKTDFSDIDFKSAKKKDIYIDDDVTISSDPEISSGRVSAIRSTGTIGFDTPSKYPQLEFISSTPSAAKTATPNRGGSSFDSPISAFQMFSKSKQRTENTGKDAQDTSGRNLPKVPSIDGVSAICTESSNVSKASSSNELNRSFLNKSDSTLNKSETTPKGDAGKVDCPVCGCLVPQKYVNLHLDRCLSNSAKKEEQRASKKMKALPKLVYSLMSDKDIRKKLTAMGLPTQGDRKTITKRHQEVTLLYNSQCDSMEPKPIEQIVREYLRQDRPKPFANKTKDVVTQGLNIQKTDAPEVIDKAKKIYEKQHKSQFAQLIADTKRRMKEKKAQKQKELLDKENAHTPAIETTEETENVGNNVVNTVIADNGSATTISSDINTCDKPLTKIISDENVNDNGIGKKSNVVSSDNLNGDLALDKNEISFETSPVFTKTAAVSDQMIAPNEPSKNIMDTCREQQAPTQFPRPSTNKRKAGEINEVTKDNINDDVLLAGKRRKLTVVAEGSDTSCDMFDDPVERVKVSAVNPEINENTNDMLASSGTTYIAPSGKCTTKDKQGEESDNEYKPDDDEDSDWMDSQAASPKVRPRAHRKAKDKPKNLTPTPDDESDTTESYTSQDTFVSCNTLPSQETQNVQTQVQRRASQRLRVRKDHDKPLKGKLKEKVKETGKGKQNETAKGKAKSVNTTKVKKK